jgi:ABC-2 type transport system permease protein
MRAVLATFSRELRAYFLSPLAYVVLFFFLVVNGFIFVIIVDYLNDPRAPAGQPLDYFFTAFWWLILLAVIPALTMRLLAEERGTGSIEVLMTAPVTENQVVVGKYLGALVFYIFLWSPTVLYGVILASYAEVDWGPVAAGYLGLVLIGALFLSIGLFASSLTRNQLIAAIITFALLLLLVLGVALLGNLVDTPWLSDTLAYLNTLDHQEELSHGIVDTRRLVLYVSGTVFFLFLTARTLENNKWS